MTAGAARRRMHAALVVAEIALSLMLLIGAGLLLRSFFLLQHVEAGFQASPAEIVTMRVSPPRARLTRQPNNQFDEPAAVRYYDRPAGTRAPDPWCRGRRARRGAAAESHDLERQLRHRRPGPGRGAEQPLGGDSHGRRQLLPHARHSPAARTRLHRARHRGIDAGDGHQRGDGAPLFRRTRSDRPAHQGERPRPAQQHVLRSDRRRRRRQIHGTAGRTRAGLLPRLRARRQHAHVPRSCARQRARASCRRCSASSRRSMPT